MLGLILALVLQAPPLSKTWSHSHNGDLAGVVVKDKRFLLVKNLEPPAKLIGLRADYRYDFGLPPPSEPLVTRDFPPILTCRVLDGGRP